MYQQPLLDCEQPSGDGLCCVLVKVTLQVSLLQEVLCEMRLLAVHLLCLGCLEEACADLPTNV